ncbi:hypothetical protein RND71_044058 [Anisodus tanguticus]|uniref:protein-serine/threonine phosphatase n=1 Tax=Anisodus tanguticus TaxID=243964 RepID=A0AAE1UMW9_9SOLA|nr:hypothetical protein RND71_044058 [Anisodus tanguticus]
MSTFSIIIKWLGNEYTINEDVVKLTDTVGDLKNELCKKTGVLPERQKLFGLKYNNKPATDDVKIENLNLKLNSKILMVGQNEVVNVSNNSVSPENDFDLPEELETPVDKNEDNIAKIQRRIKDYQVNILNLPREGKKLLVLDIDYTLFDHRSVAEKAVDLMRPYLNEFLTESYKYYDIIIWSATSMKWIQVKMQELGMENNPNYKIVCYLDSLAMISVKSPNYGVIEIKPLALIWGKCNQYSAKNTIMFDDLRRNFLMNPQSGLKIKPYRDAKNNRHKDKELYYLTKYLKMIAEREEDFTVLNHKDWHKYILR